MNLDVLKRFREGFQEELERTRLCANAQRKSYDRDDEYNYRSWYLSIRANGHEKESFGAVYLLEEHRLLYASPDHAYSKGRDVARNMIGIVRRSVEAAYNCPFMCEYFMEFFATEVPPGPEREPIRISPFKYDEEYKPV